MKTLVNLMFVMLLAAACSQQKPAQEAGASEPEVSTKNDQVSLQKIWESDTLLSTSESVYYDTETDILYVSCINGVPPNTKDGDGFIAKVSPKDGSVIELEWVTGLHAPKGMGLVGNKLYVTNIDELVIIDTNTGAIAEAIPVEGALFLNDIATDSSGNVYFSDSYTNKIHLYSNTGELTTWLASDSLGGPNGLFDDGERMMLATFGVGDFRMIDYAEQKITTVTDSIPGGDGVVKVGSDYLVSNWNGEVYYVTSEWEKEKLLDTREAGANAADIAFDEETMTLFVPTFFGNQVVAYQLIN